MNSEDFIMAIEGMVSSKGVSYMDAILLYCEENELEIELAAKLVTGSLKAKLKSEAEELHFLPKPEVIKLPFC